MHFIKLPVLLKHKESRNVFILVVPDNKLELSHLAIGPYYLCLQAAAGPPSGRFYGPNHNFFWLPYGGRSVKGIKWPVCYEQDCDIAFFFVRMNRTVTLLFLLE